MADDQPPDHNSISSKLRVATLATSSPPFMYPFTAARQHTNAKTTATEKHALIVNSDTQSPIKALLVSIHGKNAAGSDRAFSIYALGHAVALHMHLSEKGIFIADNPFRQGKLQKSALVADINEADPSRFEAQYRPDIQQAVRKGIKSLGLNIHPDKVGTTCLLNLSDVAPEIYHAHLPEGNKSLLGKSIDEVVSEQTQNLFRDLNRTHALSNAHKANQTLITRAGNFIHDNYEKSSVNVAIKPTAKVFYLPSYDQSQPSDPA